VISPDQLGPVANVLRRDAIERLDARRLARSRRLTKAQDGFEALAGLLPAAEATDVSASSASEQIGGAYDYRHNRVLLIDRVVQTRRELQMVLAHELTHAVEDQHFALRIATSRGAAQTAQARRALIEGTATFTANLYAGRFLHDQLPVGLRIAGQRSVFAAGGSTPFAIKADTIFDYVDGPLFAQRLHRRARGGWGEVNHALRSPPQTTQGILHPVAWPSQRPPEAVRLGLDGLLGSDYTLAGGGVAGEEDLRTLIGAGSPEQTIDTAASGWRGGRFELWRLNGGECDEPCPSEDVAVAGFRFRTRADVPEFANGFFDYALLGRLGQRVDPRTWSFGDSSYAVLGTAPRAAAIAFAASAGLAHRLAVTAARNAAAGSG
jgi:hypothetical protein